MRDRKFMYYAVPWGGDVGKTSASRDPAPHNPNPWRGERLMKLMKENGSRRSRCLEPKQSCCFLALSANCRPITGAVNIGGLSRESKLLLCQPVICIGQWIGLFYLVGLGHGTICKRWNSTGDAGDVPAKNGYKEPAHSYVQTRRPQHT